jgi:ATP-binding cassette, subfamily B, bacterial
MNAFRNVVACVLQDYVKYNLTLRENIALGKIENIDDDKKIIEMINKVELSKKYVDMLDEIISVEYKEGFELSGGEWQKVALARAVISDVDLIVMDEPTSSLDPVAEMNFLDYFNEQLQNKTSILVSHRLGISRHCNKIIVMDNGKIIETGSHNELMKKNGLYKTLFELQASKYV